MPKRRANGEGSLYKRKDGTWTAQYTDFTGKKRYLYGKTQQAVKVKLKDAIRQNDSGIVVDSRRISLATWIEEWQNIYKKPFERESTYLKDKRALRNHIKPFFACVQLQDIRHEMLQRFLNEKLEKRIDGQEGGYSIGVVLNLKGILHGALQKAAELGYLAYNPAINLKVPARTFMKKAILTVDQQKYFEKQVRIAMETNYNMSIYLLVLYTGLRIGEALGLQISDIDFQKKELYVQRTAGFIHELGDKSMKFYISDPKTKAGRRTIPLSPQVAILLKDHIAQRQVRVNFYRERWESRGRDMSIIDDGYLFLTIQGHVQHHTNVNKKLKWLLQSAGIPEMSMHALRHTFATRWIEAGLDVRSLADILGHADVKMTLNVYTHALPDQKRKNMDFISALFEGEDEGED